MCLREAAQEVQSILDDEDRLNWLELFNAVCGFNQSLMKTVTLRQPSRHVDEIQFRSLPLLPL